MTLSCIDREKKEQGTLIYIKKKKENEKKAIADESIYKESNDLFNIQSL